MLEYSEAFLEQNERALDELLNLLTPAGQRAAKMLAEMDLEALQPEPAEPAVAAGLGGV